MERLVSGRLFPKVTRTFRATLDLLFPPRCAGCGEVGEEWCGACHRRLVVLKVGLCTHCGVPVRDPTGLCPSCQVSPLPLATRSYARYEGPLVRALLQLKYRPNRRLAWLMGGWLTEVYRAGAWRAETVVPVPLSAGRLRQRGYNQAELIAEAFGRHAGLTCANLLVRIRETRSQVGLDDVERRSNVEAAFLAKREVEGKRIVVVDDLRTTGATLAACASALHEAGVGKVWGLTVARA